MKRMLVMAAFLSLGQAAYVVDAILGLVEEFCPTCRDLRRRAGHPRGS